MKKRNQRFLSLLLSLLMLLSLLPTAAFAAARDEDAVPLVAPAADEDTLSTPAAAVDAAEEVPAVAVEDDVPVVLAAANAEAATYDYTGTVTATAPSYQAPTGANSPAAALDNNTGTWWHTAWNGNNGGTSDLNDLTQKADKRYIQLNLTEATSIDGLRYLSRAAETSNHDYGNGVVTQYRIEVSTDGTNFTSVAAGSWEPGDAAWRVAVFPESVSAQYVRLYGVRTYGNGEGLTGDAHTAKDVNKYMSAAELRLLTGVPDDWRPTNLARLDGVTAEASQSEINNSTTDADGKALNGAAAIDGIKSNVNNVAKPSGHWSTPQNPTKPTTLTVDLHRMCSIDMVKLFWKHDAVTAYTVQGSSDGTDWTDIGSKSSRVSAATVGELVAPAGPAENIRYLKLSVTDYDNQGTAGWANVNLWEIEIYGTAGKLIASASSVLADLLAVSGGPLEVNADGTKVVLKADAASLVPEGVTVTFAANLEQVVGAGGVIYTPVADKQVKIDLTVTDSEGASASTPANSPISITIPGERAAATNNGNPKPAVIPEIMEWYSPDDLARQNSDSDYTGYKDQYYTLAPATENERIRILYRYAFADVAKELQADLKDLFGVDAKLQVLTGSFTTLGSTVQNGDIVLFDVNPNNSNEDNRNRVRGYDDETYGMEIYGGKVYIYATHPTGAYWGTRTLLQGLKLSGGSTPSFPNGTLRDYPEFKVRGFMLDVGRKPLSMDMLKTIAKNMAWYKLNDFHLHLNDNLIFMEDYCDGKTDHRGCAASAHMDYQSAYEAYSAFRMESNVQEEPGAKPLTAQDYAYTKAEFKQFIKDASALGINIIPEFDVPAHAKAITDAFPSLRLNKSGTFLGTTRPWIDHLDLTNKMDESLAKVQEIFDEYLTGSDPVFSGDVVHFGADEYYDDYGKYAPFAKGMVDYIQSRGKTVRMWGSFTLMGDNDHLFTKEVAQNIQMNLWSSQWADAQAMYDKGFQLININCYPAYIVPSGTGSRGNYGDRLNMTQVDELYPNKIENTWIHASSHQMLGAAYAIWQDNIETRACGLDEVDTFDRFYEGLPLYSERLWGARRSQATIQELSETTGTAPGTNPYYKAGKTDSFAYTFADTADQSGNGHDLTLTNAEVNSSKSLLVLKGGASYAETGLDRLGWGSQLSFRALKLTASDEEQVLFEADHAYGDYAIKALPVEGDATKWKLGFSRELYDYEFDRELPVGEWVQLTLTAAQQSTTLSVNGEAAVAAVGKFVAKPDSNTQFRGRTGVTYSSFELPVARIGSKTNAFNGYLAAVTTGEAIEVPDAFLTATAPSEMKSPAGTDVIEGPASYAVDGNLNTMWHSNWSTDSADNPNDLSEKPEKRYIQLNLATPVTVSGLHYTPRSGGGTGTVTSYRIEVSTDGESFTPVATGDWDRDGTEKTATFTPQSDVIAVRLYGVTTYSAAADDPANKFMSALEVGLTYGSITLTEANTTVTVGDVTWGETEATAPVTVALKPSGFVLTEGTDYTVSYADNTAAGTATVTVTGKGGYTGSVSATFTVPAKPVVVDLSTATVTFAQTSYPLEGGKAEPDPIVKVGGATLLRGLDYTVTYANNTAEGTATATVTGIGDYTGEKTATFTVTPAIVKKNLSDTAKTKVTLSQTTFPYDGAAITPEPVVTYDGETLTKGTHYTLSYARNNAVGTATVTVIGRAPYCEGSASATFTIVEPSQGNDLSDVNKTVVTLKTTQYEYTGQPITPIPSSVRYNGVRLIQGTDYTIDYRNNTSNGTGVLIITGIGDYYGSYFTIFTITGGAGAGDTPGSDPGNNSGSSSSGGSSGSSVPSVGPTTTEITRGDGVTTIVKTDPFGAMLTQSTYDDGTKVIADIPVTGPVTAVVTVPNRVDTVTVTIPTRGEPTPGQVAVILHPDGTEEIVKTSLPTEGGVELTLDASATVQIVDNAKSFTDVPAGNWAKDAIDFVTSREIFNGTGNSTFTPTGDMSRAMVCTVLANLAGEDTKGGATWYEKSVDWAKRSGISDGSTPNATVTREQLAAMLYRYAGSPTVVNEVPRRFRDRDAISDWAEIAVTWAVENDLIHGRGSDEGLDLAPQATATRAEVAAVLQRYVALLK